MKNKQYLNEVRQLQKIAGLLNENPVKAHMEKLIQLAKTGNEKKENILAGFSGAGIHYKVTTADPNTIKYWNHEQGLSGEVKLKENAWHPDKDWDETDDEEEDDDNGMPSDEELWGTSRSKRR